LPLLTAFIDLTYVRELKVVKFGRHRWPTVPPIQDAGPYSSGFESQSRQQRKCLCFAPYQAALPQIIEKKGKEKTQLDRPGKLTNCYYHFSAFCT